MDKQILIVDTETTGLDFQTADLLGISTCDGSNRTSFSLRDERIFDVGKYKIVCHNGKFDSKMLYQIRKTPINVDIDTQIMYYLLHIDKSKKLENIVKELFDEDKEDLMQLYNRVTGSKRKTLPSLWYTEVPIEEVAIYSQEDAYWTKRILETLQAELETKPVLKDWFYSVEMPLVNILTQTELQGVRINRIYLYDLDKQITKKLRKLQTKLLILADNLNLNLNSSQQLQEVMFKKLKLPKVRATATGQSTDVATLKKLVSRCEHAFPKLLLEYRELTKIQTAFVQPLLERSNFDGRIHASFNQMGTKTRRMSCAEPNLQQIPVKTELGQRIRSAFIPSPDHKFLIADYSQIELRLLAHFSQEPKLIKAFNNNEDIHQRTADYISKKLQREFTRREGKILNFSIIYGKTAYGFAQDWNCSEDEAQSILNIYFEYYPRVAEWIQEQQIVCQAQHGWIHTLAGLPLYVPNINSNNKWEFEEAKRQAVNYLIQGSSQDIMKKAVVNIYKELRLAPLLLVHDELVYEITNPQCGDNIIPYLMKTALPISVPIEVDSKISDHWEK